MRITLTWRRLDIRRRWRSLVALTLLVAVATTVVLTAAAGARRGLSTFDRLWASTLPATATVLPNQPGFDWAPVRALPEVTAIMLFPVYYGDVVDGLPGANIDFPIANGEARRTIERPIVLAGRMADPGRADEVNVSLHFVAWSGRGIGDTVTLHLSSVRQADDGYDARQDGGTPSRASAMPGGREAGPGGADLGPDAVQR